MKTGRECTEKINGMISMAILGIQDSQYSRAFLRRVFIFFKPSDFSQLKTIMCIGLCPPNFSHTYIYIYDT